MVLPTSVLLMIGLFLPTLQVCNDPVAPIQFPMFWTPHVVAILVFAAVLVRPWKLRGLDIALRVVLGLTAIGWGLVVVPSPGGMHGAGWLFSAALVAFLGLLLIPARSSESMVARCAVIGGAASSLWFGAIATDPDALFGAFSSTAASLGLTLGGLWWWLEQQLDVNAAAGVSRELGVTDSAGEGDGQLGGDRRIV